MKRAAFDDNSSVSNTHRALTILRELIISGELAAGSDHLESELADRLGMSRTPIREAVLTLEGRGLLEVRPRKGVRILPISPTDMAEIYDILTELESLAAERAAMAGYGKAALAHLAQSIADMDEALKAQDLAAWAEADDRFHRELVRLGGNRRAMLIFEMLRDQVARARHTTLYMRPVPSQSNDDHRAVLDAISRNDPALAAKRHRAHRQYAKTMLVNLLSKHRLQNL